MKNDLASMRCEMEDMNTDMRVSNNDLTWIRDNMTFFMHDFERVLSEVMKRH